MNFLFLIFLPMAFAASDGVQALQKMQQVEKELKKVGAKCTNCDVSTNVDPRMQDCVAKLCPQAKENPSVNAMDKTLVIEAAAVAEKNMAVLFPKFLSWFDANLDSNQKDLLTLERLLKQKSFQIDPKDRIFHNFSLAAETLSVLEVKPNSRELDRPAMVAALQYLSEDDRQWALRFAEAAVKNDRFITLTMEANSVGSLPIEKLYREQYPNDSLPEALKKDVNRMRESEKALLKFVGLPPETKPFAGIRGNERQLSEILSGRRMDQASLEGFYAEVKTMDAARELFLSPEGAAILKERNQLSIAPLVNSAKISQKVEKLRGFLEDEKKLKKVALEVLDNCLASYGQITAALPEKKGLDQAKKLSNEVRESLSESAFSELSSSSRDFLNATLAKVDVYLPKERAMAQEDFLQEIEQRIKDLKEDSNFSDSQNLIGFYDLASDGWDPEESFRKSFSYCKESRLPYLSDKAMAGRSVIWASWQSLKNPQLGRSVMAHEFGHIADFLLQSKGASDESAKSHRATRACLAEMHPEAKGEHADHFVGEDYADLVSATTFADTNIGCLLYRPEHENPILKNQNEEDTHSSNFFRALHAEQVRTGKLPKVCQEALKAAGNTTDFGSCL